MSNTGGNTSTEPTVSLQHVGSRGQEAIARFLVLGGIAPSVPGARFHDDPTAPFDALVLLGAVAVEDVYAVVRAAPDPAVPVADFGGNPAIRRDFVGDVLDTAAVSAMRRRFGPIWRRLSEMPFDPAHAHRDELLVLRLAYSRAARILAWMDPGARQLVSYGMLGRDPEVRARLESLAEHDLFRREHFMRTHLCRKCDSARLHAYEACPACGSADIVDEPIVHHYRCGWQEPEQRFVSGNLLICPKCRRELRHFGVDYDKPGSAIVCGACGGVEGEPTANFLCLDCAQVTPTSDAASLDWHHYDLTEAGVEALQRHRIPLLDISAYLEGSRRSFAPHDFMVLVAEGMRVAGRYGRPFAVARIAIGNLESLMKSTSIAEIDTAFRRLVDFVADSVRDSDFVCADGAHGVLIGLPETSAAEADKALQRLEKSLKSESGVRLELSFHAVEGQAADDLLDEKRSKFDES